MRKVEEEGKKITWYEREAKIGDNRNGYNEKTMDEIVKLVVKIVVMVEMLVVKKGKFFFSMDEEKENDLLISERPNSQLYPRSFLILEKFCFI